MTLVEIRKLYKIPRGVVAMMNNLSYMNVRTIEGKSVRDLTFGDLDNYVNALGVDLDKLVGMVVGYNVQSSLLKSSFWAFNFNYKINVRRTYEGLVGCSNSCSLLTLHKYARDEDPFKNLKLNWCLYQLTGSEIPLPQGEQNNGKTNN